MVSAVHLTLVLLCLLVTQTHGSRRVLLSSTDASSASSSPNACPSVSNNGNKLPVVHRLSPCSPINGGGGARKHGTAALREILHRDGLRLRYLSNLQTATATPAPAPSPSSTPTSGVFVPAAQNVVSSLPGVFTYTVIARYGTPAQPLPLFFDASGMSNLRCKPCSFSGASAPCDQSFDPSMSSSLRAVPCGSPDCTETACTSGSSCTFTYTNSTYVFGNGTVVTDTLTLSPSSTFDNFAVGCMQLDNLFSDGVAVGNIDLSRSRHSLTTRVLLSSSPGTAAFSYCLPADTDTHGFLDIAPTMSDYSGLAGVKYVPLVTNPTGPNFYYVDLVAITVNGKDLPFSPSTYRGQGTMIDTQAAFTYLNPPIYAALRDEFRSAMAKYQSAPAFSDLDTCYNFTGVDYITLPDISLRFGNGETMDLDDRQFMYFFRDHLDDGFPFGCLAFAAATPDPNFGWNLLGTQMQRTKEIVYDVRGGMVAFVPSRCGLR
nr:unnamed protein product [Digitaria exilis]